ncbi:MAG: M24 family metallopeptidase, partial [Dehalococcoidia bacterium]|nr:M24 family metallopeptidase [Dehalococcoidia bacterium]
MAVKLKSESEMRIMREAGQIVGQTLAALREKVKPGVDVLELEAFVDDEYERRGVGSPFLDYSPAPKYPPYPSRICISVNDELVHGIPKHRLLKEGDIVSMDLGSVWKGYVGDAAITVGVGKVSAQAQDLIDVTSQALAAGIEAAGKAKHLSDICAAIEDAIL